MGKRGHQASPVSGPSSQGSAVARGTDPQAMVRRSRIAPCVTCGLCGGFLRDAAVIPECLHSFCRQCIVEEFTDNNINRCPKGVFKCGERVKSGEKFMHWAACTERRNELIRFSRPDRSLQHIRSVIFPVKRHKVGAILPRHPSFVSLPSPSNQAHGIDHSAKKADAHLMPEPMNGETETEADERLGKKSSPSLEKVITSSPNTVVAPGSEPAWPDDSQYRQRDERREEASSALGENKSNVEELREAIEGSRIELCAPIPKHAVQFQEFEIEDHELLDKQATPQESDKLAEEVDPWTVAVEKLATDSTISAQGWSKKGWTTTMAACAPPNIRPDPWTVAVEKMATESTVSTQGWSEEGWTTVIAACVPSSIRPDPWAVAVEKMATESTVSTQGWSEEGWTTAMATYSPPSTRPDPWTIAVEKMATESTVSAQVWSEEGWTTAMAACALPSTRPDPWTIAVEKMATESTVSAQGWSEEGWATAVAACARPNISPHDALGRLRAAERANAAAAAKDADEARKEADKAPAERGQVSALRAQVQALTDVLQAERARAQVLEDQVGRLRRELEAARASEADTRRQVADDRRKAEITAEMIRHAFNLSRDLLEELEELRGRRERLMDDGHVWAARRNS